ncbi:hypothetical protein L873DRAFT_1925357, partial [Choiromyces venosus 120613-1]
VKSVCHRKLACLFREWTVWGVVKNSYESSGGGVEGLPSGSAMGISGEYEARFGEGSGGYK